MTYEEEQELKKRKPAYSPEQADKYKKMQEGFSKPPAALQGIVDYFSGKKKKKDEEQE